MKFSSQRVTLCILLHRSSKCAGIHNVGIHSGYRSSTTHKTQTEVLFPYSYTWVVIIYTCTMRTDLICPCTWWWYVTFCSDFSMHKTAQVSFMISIDIRLSMCCCQMFLVSKSNSPLPDMDILGLLHTCFHFSPHVYVYVSHIQKCPDGYSVRQNHHSCNSLPNYSKLRL